MLDISTVCIHDDRLSTDSDLVSRVYLKIVISLKLCCMICYTGVPAGLCAKVSRVCYN